MSAELPSHFCIIPWVHLFIAQNGRVTPCSRIYNDLTYGYAGETDSMTMWTSEMAETLRRSMLSPEPSPACRYCTTLTKAGVKSYRETENENFPEAFERKEWTQGPLLAGPSKPVFLELRFSNLCNLKCRTCDSQFSSAWSAEAPEIYGYVTRPKPDNAFKDKEAFDRFFDPCLDSLQVLQILGGEPLIQNEFYYLLEKLIERKRTDIKLRVTTNFTRVTHKNWDFVELSRHFPNLNISMSFDGIGPRAEYIRKNCKWAEIEANFERMRREAPETQFNVYPCVSVLNGFHIPDALDRFLELGMMHHHAPPALNFVTTAPSYYNIRILDDEERARLKLRYETYLAGLQKRVDGHIFHLISRYLGFVLKFLDGGRMEEERAEFRRITALLDNNRNESFRETFPELLSLSY